MGGQTALNCALDLAHHGVLKKHNVELIGANEHAIEKAEDRQKFKQAMTDIGLESASRASPTAWTRPGKCSAASPRKSAPRASPP